MKTLLRFFHPILFQIFLLDNNMESDIDRISQEKDVIINESDTFDIYEIPDEEFISMNIWK